MTGTPKTVLLAALLWLAALLAAGRAAAETTIRVLDTEPAGTAVTLGRNESFYLRLAYATDTPVRIWANPYFEGRAVNAGTNPSRLYEGEGEALAWFFFLGEPGGRVDEIRITAGDGSIDGTREVLRWPVRVTAGSGPASAAPQPEWLARLRAEDQRAQREAYERFMNEPINVTDALIYGVGFMLVVLVLGIGGIVLPVLAVRRWQGGWRVAACLPLAVIGFVVLRFAIDVAIDPTSHNLWPFEILQAGFVSLVLLGVLALARRLSGSGARTRRR
jgi:hypothetical protein